MVLFQPPAPTRFDLRFTLAGVPIRVHPLFWVMALIFGASAGSFIGIVTWVAVVFVSIVAHEMGHALTMRYYGISPEVVLYLGGGLAFPSSEQYNNRWSRGWYSLRQRILISLAGPCAGFLLAALVILVVVLLGGTIVYAPLFGVIPSVMAYLPHESDFIYNVIASLLWVNIFWGAINLTPVQPLDGGNIARAYLGSADPINGERTALWVSVIAGAVVAAIGALIMQSPYMGLLFGILAYQSYERLGYGSRRVQ